MKNVIFRFPEPLDSAVCGFLLQNGKVSKDQNDYAPMDSMIPEYLIPKYRLPLNQTGCSAKVGIRSIFTFKDHTSNVRTFKVSCSIRSITHAARHNETVKEIIGGPARRSIARSGSNGSSQHELIREFQNWSKHSVQFVLVLPRNYDRAIT